MKTARFRHALTGLLTCATLIALGGCSDTNSPLWLLHPNGPIARASIHYLVIDVLLLLIVVVPATALVIWTFFRYRRGGGGRFDPTFNHSLAIEFVVWGVPLLIVAALAYFTYEGVMAVDPYHPRALDTVAADSNAKPLKVDVITTDWQWLFVYPELGIAVSNHLVVPTGRKIDMQLTSTSVTNDFYVLKVVNQIYIMPGMRTEQHFLVDRPGDYRGFSTEFSGPGFSWMNYTMRSVTPDAFRQWVAKTRSEGKPLNWARFTRFARPTVNTGNRSQAFNDVAPHLFTRVIGAVKSGALKSVTPEELTEDMHSDLFKRHSTGPTPPVQ